MPKTWRNTKETILPQIKLKYFSVPKHGQDNFVCFQCKQKSDKIGSGNFNDNPPRFQCEKCAIENYMATEGYKSIKEAEARRRRMFDVSYLFQEKVIDCILVQENKKFKDLTNEEYQKALELANEMWNDKRLISREEKISLEEIYSQKEIEKVLQEIIDSVSLHRVDIEK